MSKRKEPNSNPSGSPSKRTKRPHVFGAPSADDKDPLTSQLTAPSSTALSTRTLRPSHVPALTTLCARVFVANLEALFQERQYETQEWLKVLPEAIIPPLFSMLRTSHPSLLSHPFISTFFLRGEPIILTGNLPGVSNSTVQAIVKLSPNLQDLQLTELEKIPDDTFARLLSGFPSLRSLVLRGSTKVGKKTVETAAKTCKRLSTVNLSYTSAPPNAIRQLTTECLDLEVLKLAGLSSLTDVTFSAMLYTGEQRKPLACIRSLKLRHTLISDHTFNAILSRCHLLSRLDVSFTPIRQPGVFGDGECTPSLSKLSLTSTPLTSSFLTNLADPEISCSILTSLRTLHIGALGASPTSSISTIAGSLILTDNILNSLTEVLVKCQVLESISLVGNSKLGLGMSKNSVLAKFIHQVGRRCKILNLAGIPRLRSSDLAGLPPANEQTEQTDPHGLYGSSSELGVPSETPSPLHTLVLNNTGVGDDASRYIATCTQLTVLELAGTKFTYDSIFHILDSCPLLTKLDLTSCRGVKVVDRRRFFEVWEDRRNV